jgi:putative transposase
MPRKPREEAEGAVHHVYARGNRKQRIYLDDRDRVAYLRLLGLVVSERGWRCLAYCLMNNHLHLLVETPQANLGVGMDSLQGGYAQGFNRRHGHTGHVFQGPYGSERIHTDDQFWWAVRYIAMNPVEAGLCARPEQWRWSSAGGGEPWVDHARLLEFLGARGGDPRRRYAELLNPRPS